MNIEMLINVLEFPFWIAVYSKITKTFCAKEMFKSVTSNPVRASELGLEKTATFYSIHRQPNIWIKENVSKSKRSEVSYVIIITMIIIIFTNNKL